jgi:two-component system, OmpR family, alkaline phosphatase synthesis response regulator PhoP
MAQETILLIEDEKNIMELVKYNIEQESYHFLYASRGDLGLELARKSKPDLIVLDLMLPEIDGLEICKILKQNEKTSAIPIIMLTAKSQETDRIVGLEMGADDYVTKPFSPRELVARIKAVLRRGKEVPKDKLLKSGTLEIDTGKYVVSLKGKPIQLTSKEYDLLKALIEASGRVLSREALLEQVWGYDESLNVETRTVDMHVGQLRKKIKTEAHRIITVKNVGYRFEIE